MPDGYLTRHEAHDCGLSDEQIRSAVRSGLLTRIRHGAFADTETWESLTSLEQYRLQVIAAAARASSDVTISHQSAAALHHLPMLRPDLKVVHVSADGYGGGKRGHRTVHRVALGPADVTELNGLRVTTMARTAVDVACNGTFEQAVCVVESALRAGASEASIAECLLRLGRRQGIAVARRAVDFADGKTESIGESWSRAQMAQWPDIPLPRLQHEFRTADGHFVARTDFDWEGKLVGEFDGRMKYRDGATDAVIAERQRENRLHAMGIHVVRWTWDDLRRPGELRRILRQGLDRVGL